MKILTVLLCLSLPILGSSQIDAGQFSLGATVFQGTGVTDIQSGKGEVNGRTYEGFARLRLSIVYLKASVGIGEWQQQKLERFYTNKHWLGYLETGLQTGPDFLTVGDLGFHLQSGIGFGRIGADVRNHLTDQVQANAGALWEWSYGAAIEWDGMFTLLGYDMSPTITIERTHKYFFEDFVWDGITGGEKNDYLKGWKLSLSFRIWSW